MSSTSRTAQPKRPTVARNVNGTKSSARASNGTRLRSVNRSSTPTTRAVSRRGRTEAASGRASSARANNHRAGRSDRPTGETPKARGERTRRRVADALIDLIDEGDPSPTAKAVAARAGVSVRLVFHHFEDMEALYRLVMEVQTARHWESVREVAPDLPLAQRIDRTVQQRGKLFDTIGPVRRAELPIAARRADIAAGLARSDLMLRDWLETTFTPELDGAGRNRRELLDAVDVAASWETWDRLRRHQHLSAASARRVMSRMLSSLMGS